MPSANGIYSLPVGYLAVDGQVITPETHNVPLQDIAAALTLRLSRDGTAPMTGALKLADGSASVPSLTLASAPSTGLFKSTNGVGVAVAGTQVAEFGSSGILSGITTASIADQAVTLQKLWHPGLASALLGTHSISPVTITGAANNGSGLVRLTVSSTATLTTTYETVSGVAGTTEANGRWALAIVDSTHVDLVGSTFVNAYTSGGMIGGGIEILTLGTGLTLNGYVLSSTGITLPGAVGLRIKNNASTPNTSIDVTANMVTMVNSSGVPIFNTSPSLTINATVNGAGGLDTGSLAANSWYNVFLMSNGGATNGLLSLSTAPTLPSSFTYSVRLGAVKTDGSGNFLRTRQVGNCATFTPVSASNTTAPLVMVSGGTGSTWTAIATGSYVPPTANKIKGIIYADLLTNNSAGVAPNNNYPTNLAAASTPWGLSNATGGPLFASQMFEFILESSNIYYGQTGANPVTVSALGWTDAVNAS